MTSGTPSSMRKAEELSTTVHPAAEARGAYFLEMEPPAEKSAMSTSEKLRASGRREDERTAGWCDGSSGSTECAQPRASGARVQGGRWGGWGGASGGAAR
jgi:hypothetical protein